MTLIDQLNRRLGDSLGYVRSGSEARFSWRWAPDIPYWASRLGKVWVLCQWQKPGMTEQDWRKQFGDRFPYPVNGMHHAHPETALPPGHVPSAALTQFYIRTLDEQMSRSFEQQLSAVNQEMTDDQNQNYADWVDKVQDSNPAFSNFAPGDRGGHVSYGGL